MTTTWQQYKAGNHFSAFRGSTVDVKVSPYRPVFYDFDTPQTFLKASIKGRPFNNNSNSLIEQWSKHTVPYTVFPESN